MSKPLIQLTKSVLSLSRWEGTGSVNCDTPPTSVVFARASIDAAFADMDCSQLGNALNITYGTCETLVTGSSPVQEQFACNLDMDSVASGAPEYSLITHYAGLNCEGDWMGLYVHIPGPGVPEQESSIMGVVTEKGLHTTEVFPVQLEACARSRRGPGAASYFLTKGHKENLSVVLKNPPNSATGPSAAWKLSHLVVLACIMSALVV
ncbi:hypothetical protein HDU85_006887 [Gaertneriomyces sp. JEL0708]|nr:hypothetical protein HDU85_006887 [Gaertneriomyces sp. JEL0708]